MRTLAADVGAALGCGATLAGLVRTRVGPYALEAAVAWDEVREARTGEQLWARLLPPDSALAGLAAVRLDADGARAFAHGQAAADRRAGHRPRSACTAPTAACSGWGRGSATG